jgi:hypothetical protein
MWKSMMEETAVARAARARPLAECEVTKTVDRKLTGGSPRWMRNVDVVRTRGADGGR